MPRGGRDDSPDDPSLDDLLPEIYRFALYLTGDPHDAEDVTQNVCFKFLKYRKSYDPRKGGLKVYLQRLTVNESNTLFSRKKKKIPEDYPVWESEPESRINERMEERNTAAVILSLLVDLTEREREVFVMREVMDMDYPLIAEVLQVSPVTVRRFYSLARQKLKELLLTRFPEYRHLMNE
ncbi:MAG TPA: sigma-70 family RNA polymerase sigma factor [Thermoanaerobaculia bacterium]|nr:sigma-70 family RNA polymerase sigma factor [Thermoanaerobaculia bacterium]HUM28815.1 sigma-70 family RNA polymerase sigma factor [Thermoanaerobaculia bacterium]HXK69072.1 sigma-70 family RNA polymerase sigma factor [Thermoanaerobaculia bacterium]